MKHLYFLEMKRIGFSHWNSDDVKQACTLWQDHLVTTFISVHDAFTNEQVEQHLKQEILSQLTYNVQYCPMFELTTHTFIGCCGLHMYDVEKQIYEIGFHLLPSFWGKGFAKEAANQIIHYARNIFAGHHPNNQGSKQLLTKLGFHYVRDEYYEPTGIYHPSYLYYKEPK